MADPARPRGAALLALALLLAACSGSTTPEVPVDTAPVAETVPDGEAVVWTEPEGGRRRLIGFDAVLATVTTDDGRRCEVCLMVAETPEQKTRGLMHVTDPELGGHDGLVFVSDEPVTSRFWMRNTPLPLTAVFFDVDGRHLDTVAMEPCPDDTPDAACPRHGPAAPHRYGVELAARTPAELLMEPGSVLHLTDRPCPRELAGR